jgi:hypothetical protein
VHRLWIRLKNKRISVHWDSGQLGDLSLLKEDRDRLLVTLELKWVVLLVQ